MSYSNNTRNFTELDIQVIWEKGHIDPGYNSFIWRRDDYGDLICRSDYGDRNSVFGWEIDHIKPVSVGGTDSLFNLRPLQWKNNVTRPWYWG